MPVEPISNELLATRRDVVFTSSDARHSQVPLAGRRDETAFFLDAVADAELEMIRLSAPLGTGKTFFLNRLWGVIAQEKLFDFDQAADVLMTTVPAVNQVGTVQAVIDSKGGIPQRLGRRRAIVVIEEFDRKWGFDDLMAAARQATTWLEATSLPSPLLILTGDAFLGHTAIENLCAGRATRAATLQPLDRDLLIEALARRMDQARGMVVDDRDEPSDAAVDAAAAILQDERIGRGLLPPTEPVVATFRDALVTLGSLADKLPTDRHAVRVPGELLSRIVQRPTLSPEADELARVVLSRLGDDTFFALHTQDLVAMLRRVVSDDELIGNVPDYEDLEYFREEAIEPLVHGLIVEALGVPYQQFDPSGSPVLEPGPPVVGPFVPAPSAYRLAAK